MQWLILKSISSTITDFLYGLVEGTNSNVSPDGLKSKNCNAFKTGLKESYSECNVYYDLLRVIGK